MSAHPKPPSSCLNHPQEWAVFLSLDCWFQQDTTQLTGTVSTAGNKWEISQIAVILFSISCWVSGLLSTAASPFLELTLVLFQRNNTGKSDPVTQPRISRKWNPSYELGEKKHFQFTDPSECKRDICLRCSKAVGKMGLKRGRLDCSWGWPQHSV